MSKPPAAVSRTRHNLGESFLHALDDIRQKVVEEGWTGSTQTPSNVLQLQYSDFVSWLYGGGAKDADRGIELDRQMAGHALSHAVNNGALDTAREIAAASDLKSWCAGIGARTPEPQTPSTEAPGLEL